MYHTCRLQHKYNKPIKNTKGSFFWAELFIVIERSEIQGGSSVFVPRGPDLACVWGGHDLRLSQCSLLRMLSQKCDNL